MYFDIGANRGRWAYANINAADKIICVEASPSTFTQLHSNISQHPKITCLNYAVCDNSGQDITFYHCPNADVLSTLNKEWLTAETSRFYNTAYTEIICKTITMDNLIQTYGVPSLIKIDVEGGEYECIKSLHTKVDTLCFEWASETNSVTFKCLDYLEALGYTQFHIQHTDTYTYRPSSYTTIADVKTQLNNSRPKHDWGMIWCH
jgi:FkbM family methyltransferase